MIGLKPGLNGRVKPYLMTLQAIYRYGPGTLRICIENFTPSGLTGQQSKKLQSPVTHKMEEITVWENGVRFRVQGEAFA